MGVPAPLTERQRRLRRAGIVFIDSFMGSFATIVTSRALTPPESVHIHSDSVQWDLLADAAAASFIAGVIALITYVRAVLAEENKELG